LTAKGTEFTGNVRGEGWGITAQLKVPGAGEMTLYHPPATSRWPKTSTPSGSPPAGHGNVLSCRYRGLNGASDSRVERGRSAHIGIRVALHKP